MNGYSCAGASQETHTDYGIISLHMIYQQIDSAEQQRLEQNELKQVPLEYWGPYLSERQWGTVREDYSPYGTAWDYFPHDHARSRAYRWGEDGIAGISDFNQDLCFAPAFWNGRDPILKERLFGLNAEEGNHGEDVKELYFYLDNTPTHSYMEYLYQYPQLAFPYQDLVATNRSRGKSDPEYEILDTGVFDEDRYFDIRISYAKNSPTDILVDIAVTNHYKESASLTLLPQIWFRNKWSFHRHIHKPSISLLDGLNRYGAVKCTYEQMPDHYLYFQPPSQVLFTENETNKMRLYGYPNDGPCVKDSFHEFLINGNTAPLLGRDSGTKCAPVYLLQVGPAQTVHTWLRLSQDPQLQDPFGKVFPETFRSRKQDADQFYQRFCPPGGDADTARILRQSFSGLLWNKQFYNYNIPVWLLGDPTQIPPPASRKEGRNANWKHLINHDVLSMPDKWEYPWYAAWDLAFHTVALSLIDPSFAKNQLTLIMREWYMHPNGQIPAYEWNFSDVNPPVHAWAALEIYRNEKTMRGSGDLDFLKGIFQKLLINFTWWVNRKDANGNNIFEGGFLGLDNISLFNRSAMLPDGGLLEQADGTSWMGLYALNMMEMALEIARYDRSFENVATKFYEHFVYIAESLNDMGLWNEEDGFFYDILSLPDGASIPLRIRSAVGLTSLFAVSVIEQDILDLLPDFRKRVAWFRDYRNHWGLYLPNQQMEIGEELLFSLVHKERLIRLLNLVLDESEFLSGSGVRSVSKFYLDHPYSLQLDHSTYTIDYEPGESTTGLFGGNSNWRGPVWMPINFLLIHSLKKFHRFYGDSLKVECPRGSGNWKNLEEVAQELSRRLISIFRQDAEGNRKVFGEYAPYFRKAGNSGLVQFFEYFHGDTGRGVGASHQTGWTALISSLILSCGWN